MIEIYLLSAVCLILSGVVLFMFQRWDSRAREREQTLLAIIRRLENRIHAKDVTTYHQLERADRETPEVLAERAKEAEAMAMAEEQVQKRYYAGNGHY